MRLTDLGYPAFLARVTAHMPSFRAGDDGPGHGLAHTASGQDLSQDARTAANRLTLVQHAARDPYYQYHQLDMPIMGRRTADGNYMGDPQGIYHNNAGLARHSPVWG
jgi:hypothetical protein